jgi:hypothetical protein
MAKPGPEASAGAMSFNHMSTPACSFVNPRGQMRSTSTLAPSEASGDS